MSQDKKDSPMAVGIYLPLLPLRDILVFPSTVLPLFVGRDKSIQALEQAMSINKEIILCAQKNAKINEPCPDDIFPVGTITSILQLLRLPDGTVKVLIEGKKRAKIKRFVREDDFFLVEVDEIIENITEDPEHEALIRSIKTSFDNYVRLNKNIPPEMSLSIAQIDDKSKLSDTLILHLASLKLEQKQELLEESDPKVRLETLYGYIQSEIEIMRVEKKIRARVKRQMEKTQKEYYLNEQIAAIQKELGGKDEAQHEMKDLADQIKEKKFSEEVREKLNKELKKLKFMSPMAAEATVVRNYIDTVLSLPWGEFIQEIKDITYAEKILDADHFGLEKVKERILEFLSVNALVENMKAPILCLVGPPGVGKTSLARSVAQSTGRPFVKIAVGGIRDEAEIRGHRRTYIGSMPGKIILGLKKAGKSNPVILLDEIDKLSNDFRGDPSSALLEVLDPEQNQFFNDHYLDLDYDLSRCLFIATANTIHNIPRPLFDRMEIIHISGYTEFKKIEIAKRHLIPKQSLINGFDSKSHQIKFQTASLHHLISYYTRESGVRNLDREIGSLYRKIARKNLQLLEKRIRKEKGISAKDPYEILAPVVDYKNFKISEHITPKAIEKYLGPKRFRVGMQNTMDEIGISTGLAWTETGGDILIIEVTILPGKGKLMITGKLGEVMQESAQAALSYVRSRANFLNFEQNFYQKVDIHIHVPEGAIPKDGPSAGICMATALTSALTKRPVSKNVAMTGEITLRGRVLPIGGLKEKFLAAHRAGIKKILFPKDNKTDTLDVPKNILKEIELVSVDHMDAVLIHSLAWNHPVNTSDQDPLFKKLQKTIANELEEMDHHIAH